MTGQTNQPITGPPALPYQARHGRCSSAACDRAWDKRDARKRSEHRARRKREQRIRREQRNLPWSTEASWYDDRGETASEGHYPLGVASHYEGACDACGLPFGMHLRICRGSTCIEAVVQDRGPYIAGRELDLNPGAKDALGCDGTCMVRYGPMRH